MPPTLPRLSALTRLLATPALVAALGIGCLGAALGLDFDRLQQALVSRFGTTQLPLLQEWRGLVDAGRGLSEREKVRRVNDFFNQRIAFDDDYSVWRQSDYWATPVEFMGQRAGDCEDFSIAKYYSLLELGIPLNKLRLVYVKATQQGPYGPVVQAHMVLAYYASPGADPLILDNLDPSIQPASRRGDLAPIFSFNGAGLWQGTGQQSSRSSLSRWQDLLSRARSEGFQ